MATLSIQDAKLSILILISGNVCQSCKYVTHQLFVETFFFYVHLIVLTFPVWVSFALLLIIVVVYLENGFLACLLPCLQKKYTPPPENKFNSHHWPEHIININNETTFNF